MLPQMEHALVALARHSIRQYLTTGERLELTDELSAELLPDSPQVTTAKQQLAVTRRKAAIRPDEPVELYRFEVMRYH